MPKLLVIADDFTGAMDTGVQFSKLGIKTLVALWTGAKLPVTDADTEVLVINAEIRHVLPARAYDEMYKIAKAAYEAFSPDIYVKIDSTLRGNIGGMLAAVMDAAPSDCKLVLAPAFPAQGRVTKGGIQYVRGKPLTETEAGRDPFTPVTSSYIPEIIGNQTGIPVSLSSPADVEKRLKDNKKREIIVADAENEDDLSVIAATFGKSGAVYAGCAGLASHIAGCGNFSRSNVPCEIKAERTLVVCGSLNPQSLAQIQKAAELGVPCLILEDEQKKRDDYVGTRDGVRFIDEAAEVLKRQGVLIFKLVKDEKAARELLSSQNFESRENIRIAENVGKMTAAVLKKACADTLIVFGGDTLYGIMKSLNAPGLIPQAELYSGVVQSSLPGTEPLNIISKAGGFGDDGLLVSLLEKIQDLKN